MSSTSSEGLLLDTLKKTVKHSFIYGLGTSFAAISGIVLVPLYTRFLNPNDYGIYSLIGVIFSLLFFLYDFGMVNALFRWYYQYDEKEIALRRRVISTTLIFLFIVAATFTVILWINAAYISKYFFASAAFSGLIKLMLLGALLQSLTWVPLSILRIKEKALTFTIIVIMGMIVMIAANFILLFMGRGLNGIYEAYILAYLFMSITLFLITRKEYNIDFSLKELKGMLKFGLPYLPVLFFSWVIDFADRYLLSHMASFQQVGLYSVGHKIGQGLYLVEKTFLIAWVPLMLSLYQRYKDDAPEIFGKVFTYYLFTIFFICLAVSVFSKEIIYIFATPPYYAAAQVVPLIAFSYLLNGIYIYMLSGLIIAKNVYLQPIILSVSAMLNIGLNIILIPKFGMMGSAAATLVSYLLVAVATYFFAQKLYPIHTEWMRIGKIVFSVSLIYFLSAIFFIHGFAASVLYKGALLGLFFPILYTAGFFNQNELKRLKLVFFKN